MIIYQNSAINITPQHLGGFFEGWPDPPSRERHLELLQKSDYVCLALDDSSGQVVGFITAVSDTVMSAYIPLLEVLSPYRGRGIGTQLVKLMLNRLEGLYMIDLLCDQDLVPFYERAGMQKCRGMCVRNYKRQSCK